ncbi:MAG: peptidase M48, partial [Bacteroidota bacterium]
MLLTFLLIACGTSKDGDFTLFSVEEDLALGKELSQSISSDPVNYPIVGRSESPSSYALLDRILKHILTSSNILHRDEMAWELHIIDNDSIQNAFCTPGG